MTSRRFAPKEPIPFLIAKNIQRKILLPEFVNKQNETLPIKLVVPEEDDYDIMVEFLCETFAYANPVCLSIDITPEELIPMFGPGIKKGINDGLSVIALNEKNEIIGAVATASTDFSGIERIPNFKFIPKKDYGEKIDNGPYEFRKLNQLHVFIYELFNSMPHLFFDVNKVSEQMFIGVHPEINANGLGTQIIHESKKLAKEKGLELQMANCAAVASLKAFTKAGFQPAVSFPYSDFYDYGNRVFGEQIDDGQALTMVAIRH